MIHLIFGPIGAGKTTYAINLAEKEGAVRFSEDEWLAKLFVPDAPEGLLEQPMSEVDAWATEKYQRCREQIWLVCEQLLLNKTSIILDGAAANKEQRDIIRMKAEAHNVEFQLHYVTSEEHIRKERVLERNVSQGRTYSLSVTPEMFTHTESYFSPPSGRELSEAILVNT